MKKFSCYLVGKDNLLIECGKLLISSGHHVLGVFSLSSQVQNWTQKNNISLFKTLDDLASHTTKNKSDYLFSIVNDHVLPENIILSPKYFSINYHDSLLPLYAGVHATSWAILNREKKHGITWHVMEKGIDTGDILIQDHFDIERTETAFSLNLKCYESAISNFSKLVQMLACNTYCRIPQNLEYRTYYGLYQKPDSYGWIDWNNTAHQIARTIRAFDFGEYNNTLITAKCMIGEHAFIVTKIRISSVSSQKIPGYITNIDNNSITVATKTKNVILSGFKSVFGDMLNIKEYCTENNLKIGLCLPIFPPIKSDQDKKILQRISKYEAFWAEKNLKTEEIDVPFMEKKKSYEPISNLTSFVLKKTLLSKMNKLVKNPDSAQITLSLLFIYLIRINNKTVGSILYGDEALSNMVKKIDYLLSNHTPLTVSLNDDLIFEEAFNRIHNKILELKSHLFPLNDLFSRYRGLKKTHISIIIGDSIDSFHHFSDLVFLISNNGEQVSIFAKLNLINKNTKIILKNIQEHIKTMSHAIVEFPKYKIANLPLITPKEKELFTIDWNHTKTPYPKNKTIQHIFENIVKHQPNNIAVLYENSSITYEQLNSKSNQLAHFFIKRGLENDQHVGVILERSVEYVITIIAILKAGGTYVPIDPDHPCNRIAHIIKDCNLKFCVTTSLTHTKLLDLFENDSIILIDTETSLEKQPNNNIRRNIKSHSIANIMYTSGSTGYPKGIEILHKGIIRLVKNTNFVGVKSNDIVAHIANPMFDAATFELWSALLNGAVLSIINKEKVISLDSFNTELLKNNISILLVTSAFFDLIVHSSPSILKKMNTLIVVGDVLSTNSVLKLYRSKQQPLKIINGYGPTENTGATTFFEITKYTEFKHSIPIGKPISNTCVYVCDRNNQLLPIGAIGELLTGGDGLARGYLNNHSLTKEKFIKNIFTHQSSRLYKTGDLVRWLPTGNIEYIGRIDKLVKIRGYRVELSEIEHTLLSHPKITSTIVTLNQYSDKNKQLIAFLILKENVQASSNEIKQYVSSHLPDYMVPSTYLFVDEFPLNYNGKVDLKKLLDSLYQNNGSDNNLLPNDPRQLELIKIWCNIFKINHLSIHDNFFELGGDSIIAMQIQFEARQIGMAISVKNIFTYKTIIDLAPHVKSLQIKEELIASPKSNHKKIPFTPIQSWFLEQEFIKPSEFSQYCFIKIKTDISPELLAVYLKQIIDNHDCFQLRYRYNNHKWIQHYSNKVSNVFSFQTLDILDFYQIDREMLIKQHAHDLHELFDLEKGPLFSVSYIHSLSDNQNYLLFIAHHLIFDGVSWRILLNNLDNICSGQPITFDEKNKFTNWSSALLQYAKTHKNQLQSKYFINISQNQNDLTYDFENGINDEQSTEFIQKIFSTEETHILIHDLGKQLDIRLDDFLLIVCGKIICEWQKLSGITIDVERHGRENIQSSIDPSNIMGWFTSLFPIHLSYTSTNFNEQLLSIKQNLESIRNNGIGYGILKYLLNFKEALQNKPLISFNYWGNFDSFLDANSNFEFKSLGLLSNQYNKRTHQINIESFIFQGKLRIKWIYSGNYFRKSTIEKIAQLSIDNLRQLLFSIGKQPISLPATAVRKIHNTKALSITSTINSYPLTALQTGLLFHTVNTPGCEAYAVQLVWGLPHNCNLVALKNAFKILLHRHPLLRTDFEWKGLAQPMQHVRAHVELPWHAYDWTNSNSKEQEMRLDLFLKTDRQTNFSLARAPLMRVHIIELAKEQYHIVVTMHHILLDGWSMATLIKELGDIYNAYISHNSLALPQAPSFFSYIDQLQTQNQSPAKKKWKKYLNGFYTPTDLPIIKKQNQKTLIDYQEHTLGFEFKTSNQIELFCQKYQITLSTLMQATWALVLTRYTGQQDVIFGLTTSVRPSNIKNIETMIGPAINTIPFRVKINEHQTTINFLKKIQETFVDLLDISSSSLADIHSWSSIEKGEHLFNTILVVENYPSNSDDSLGTSFQNIKIIDPTHYPLTISVSTNKSLSIRFSYDTNHIDINKLQYLVEHFKTILLEILHKPFHQMIEIEMLSDLEKDKLGQWNNTKVSYDETATIDQLFEKQVETNPNNIALCFENETITYQVLNEKVNQIAWYLRSKGITLNTTIALCIKRSHNMIIWMLAVLKIGGTYIPIDPEYPKDRIKHMLEDSLAKFIIADSETIEALPSTKSQEFACILIDQKSAPWLKQSKRNLNIFIPSNHIVYIIYTSGSTGKPKGVMIEHSALLNFLHAMQQILGINQTDKWLAITPISFDISGLEIYLPLIHSAECVIASKHEIIDGRKLTNLLYNHKISVLQATPMTWEMLLEAGWHNHWKTKILCGGEPLKMKLCQKLLAETKFILNLYGPTETTIWSTYYWCEKSKPVLPIVPIGRPIANTKVYVLDKHLKLTPIGITGDLYISGSGLASGYFNQPQLTQNRFIPNPFGTENDSLLYKTGDLASWLPDGSLEYVGRTDEQIKIRGHRVELGEIQSQIEAYSYIEQAIVLFDKETELQQAIIACIIPQTNFDEHALREYLKNFLPIHMIPSFFVVFREFPLTPNNKVDKIKLLKLAKKNFLSSVTKKVSFETPFTHEEKLISEIWSRVLHIPMNKINKKSDFFGLGGHSLKALQVLAEIKHIFNLDLEVKSIFECYTLEKLANKILLSVNDVIDFKTSKEIKHLDTQDSCLIGLKKTGTKPPLFLIHPIGGTVFWYVNLAKIFDSDRPLYGIQDPDINSEQIKFKTVPELASFYISIMQKIQPEGPYLIGGASAGSNISMEIAAQLILQRQKIGFIALLDGWAYYPSSLEDKEIFESLMMRQYYMMEQQFVDNGIHIPDQLLRLQWHRSQMHRQYVPQCVDTKLTLFKANEVLSIFQPIENSLNHWENYSTHHIEIISVPGDHETMFQEPNVQSLSKKLCELIDKTGL